ncbi:hypothetical protein BDF22DRAFT_741401 [Syncephalis plumigaleata]|nr:hypothetical protein BDF22DRAFT_741401 [Syncephalis plumigaleata]
MQQTSLVANGSSSSCHTTSIRSSDHDASQGLKLLWTPVRMAISIVQSTYAQFCALPSQTRQCSLSLLHMSLANGQAFLEVSGNVWCYFFHSVVTAINVGGPPPMRYRIGGSKFYEGVAILVTGAIPSDDAIEMNESIGARVINQLWSLGYTVVMMDIPSSTTTTTTTTTTSNDNHAATDASTSSQTKHRPKFIKRHSTSGGRVMRISSVILEKTLERLRKHRIVLAAVVHMAAESASATQVNHSALDSLAHDLLSSNIEQQGQASALNRNTKNNNNNNNNDNDNGDGKTGYLRRSSIDAATTAINAVSKPYSLPSAASASSASSASALTSTHRAEIEWRHATIWAQRTLPHLIHTGGRIVFLNAPVSLAASPADRACAEQIAVLARQLRAELAKENISVSLVQPDDLVYDVNRPHTLVDCFATPTLQAASAVEHAVGACWPRRRYAVGWSVRLLDALHRIMGEAVADGLTTMTSTLLEMKRARDERMNQAAQQYQQQRQQHDKYHHSTVEQSSSLAMLTTITSSSTSASTSNRHHYNNNNDDDDDDEEGEAMEMEHGRIVNVTPHEQEYSMVSGSFTTPHLTSTPNTSTQFKRQNKSTTCKQPSMPLLSSRSSLSSSLSSQRHRDDSKSSILDTRTSSSVVII